MIRGHFLRMASYLPHVKEPVIKGHFIWDMEVSLADRFHCLEMSLAERFYCVEVSPEDMFNCIEASLADRFYCTEVSPAERFNCIEVHEDSFN